VLLSSADFRSFCCSFSAKHSYHSLASPIGCMCMCDCVCVHMYVYIGVLWVNAEMYPVFFGVWFATENSYFVLDGGPDLFTEREISPEKM